MACWSLTASWPWRTSVGSPGSALCPVKAVRGLPQVTWAFLQVSLPGNIALELPPLCQRSLKDPAGKAILWLFHAIIGPFLLKAFSPTQLSYLMLLFTVPSVSYASLHHGTWCTALWWYVFSFICLSGLWAPLGQGPEWALCLAQHCTYGKYAIGFWGMSECKDIEEPRKFLTAWFSGKNVQSYVH